MKKQIIVLCLCLFTVAAYAARSPQEIKNEIKETKLELRIANAAGSDMTALKLRMVELRREFRSLAPRSYSQHLDSGGDTCDDAPVIDTFPYYDMGVIDESTGNDYVSSNECGDDGREYVYKIQVSADTEGPYSISTCGSSFDTVLELWNLCPDDDGATLIACDDDDFCNGNFGATSCIGGVNLTEGIYYLVIFGYDFDMGNYDLTVVRSPTCTFISNCDATADNSYCSSAEPLFFTNGIATVTGNTYDGAYTPIGSDCSEEVEACGLWYSVTGVGSMMFASTCDSATSFDTKLHVFRGTCNGLECVVADDDWTEGINYLCDVNNVASHVSWCAEAGVEYFILVSGYEEDTGDFLLEVLNTQFACGPCDPQDYTFSLDDVPFCECLTICEGYVRTIYVGPAGPNDQPESFYEEGCYSSPGAPHTCDTDCPGADLVQFSEWVYNENTQMWSIEYSAGMAGCICFCIDRILPVELNNFTAIAGDGEVALRWSTASEANLDRFEIVRSDVTMAAVPAQNAPEGANYAWTDNTVNNGMTYHYSLIAVNMDGTRQELALQAATPQAGQPVVSAFALHQNYPNPFNPETNITFDLAETAHVTLTIYNVSGRDVATLADGALAAGRHSVRFDGTDLASGVYFYSIQAGSFTNMKKMVLLK